MDYFESSAFNGFNIIEIFTTIAQNIAHKQSRKKSDFGSFKVDSESFVKANELMRSNSKKKA